MSSSSKALLLLLAWLWPAVAAAGPADTRDALDRLEELLEVRVEDGRLPLEKLAPALVVSTEARYEESADWFATSALEVLQGALGPGSLRLCEACTQPRVQAHDASLLYESGPASLDELRRLDALLRGDSPAAKSAIWVDEHRGGVTVRIVELSTGQVLYAQNVDPMLVEVRNTRRTYTLAEELERRARGDSLTQSFADFALYPGQHLSVDIDDQFGQTNANLAGVTLSLFDPVIGIGGNYHRVTQLYNISVGAKVIFSLPTAIVASVSEEFGGEEVIDPLLTGVAIVRVPFGRSNYGAVLCASTNGQLGVGISLMNIRLLPILP
ncbi:MAG: hypothetical protein H6741_31450 [Alphaproteobacteria bacterium]|nr:hypothetical protein [Alphaproteobacteria bacterium]